MTSSTEYFIVGPFFPLSFLEPLILHKADVGKERPSVIGIRPLFGGCEVYKAEYPTGRKAENLIVFSVMLSQKPYSVLLIMMLMQAIICYKKCAFAQFLLQT